MSRVHHSILLLFLTLPLNLAQAAEHGGFQGAGGPHGPRGTGTNHRGLDIDATNYAKKGSMALARAQRHEAKARSVTSARKRKSYLSRANRAYSKAVDSLRNAMALAPDSAEVATNLGKALRGSGENEQSLSVLSHTIRQNAGYYPAYVELGRTLVELEEYSKARQTYEALQSNNPNNASVLMREYGAWSAQSSRSTPEEAAFVGWVENQNEDQNNELNSNPKRSNQG